jgi:hypothetical protein
MTAVPNLALNTIVSTPNGRGLVEGNMYADGFHYILVRHFVKTMTGKAAGTCVTPNATISSFWCYEEKDIRLITKGEE